MGAEKKLFAREILNFLLRERKASGRLTRSMFCDRVLIAEVRCITGDVAGPMPAFCASARLEATR